MKKPFEIRIETILGGQSPTTHFAGAGQFRASLGIDPAQPIDDNDTAYSTIASGLLRPVASEKFSSNEITSAPLWIKTNPKNSTVYVYGANGSVSTIDPTFTTVTAMSDAGELSASLGNGMEYCDNYMYFAKNTTIARLGPLNGVTTLNGDYWGGTLTKTALSNTTYPTSFKNNIQLPNHPMCRHSNGKLYFGDVVGNQGYIHYINTKKTTIEGDTNDGSTYLALGMGYGLWPTVIESWNEELAIALYEGSNTGLRQKHAKIAFWDTTTTNISKIVWVEFPDAIITAMKNVNGILYVVSGNYKTKGFRVSRFIGGYSFEEIYYSETGEPCLPGAIDGILNRVVFGSHTTVPEARGCAYAVGLQKASLGSGVYNVMGSSSTTSSTSVTAVSFADATSLGFYTPIIGWTEAGDGSTDIIHGLDKQGVTYNNSPSVFWGSTIRIGQSFKITEVAIPLAQAVGNNMLLTPKIYVDDGANSYTLKDINITNDSGKYNITRRSGSLGEVMTGEHNFWLELRWTGSALCTVNLPIIIKGEVYDD
jgi:hypothetical protein